MLIDSHAHLDMSHFGTNLEEVIERAASNQVERIVTVGCDIPSSMAAIDIAQRLPGVYATVGFHPHDASRMDEAGLGKLRDLCNMPRVVAVGEIGLDFYRDRSPRPVQVEAFRKQLALAHEVGLPVIIHDREAHEEVLTILRPWAAERKRLEPSGLVGVIHCFSGDLGMAIECLSLGFLISIAGPVTYPNSRRLVEVVKNLPLESLLIETDCPFLAPQEHRGTRNEPAFVRAVAEEIAKIKGISFETVSEITTRNANTLFRLDLASQTA